MNRILYVPQLTAIDKKTFQYNIHADSNVVIMKCIAETMWDSGVEFDVMIPPGTKDGFTKKFLKYPNWNFILEKQSNTLVRSAFTLRYDFDMTHWFTILKNEYDAIIIHTPPLVNNINALVKHMMLTGQLKNKPKIIAYLHFTDVPSQAKVPEEFSYFYRQMEGLANSYLPVTQSYANSKVIIDNARKYMPYLYMPLPSVWNATYSQTEIDKYNTDKNNRYEDKIVVNFPNRLSSTNYSNHEIFFEVMREINKNRDDIICYITNPSKYIEDSKLEALVGCPVESPADLDSREEYVSRLHRTDIVVALFNKEAHGGVSSKEAMAAGCLPIFPRCYEYEKLMDYKYPGYCLTDLSNLEATLEWGINECKNVDGIYWTRISKQNVYKRDSVEYNGKEIRETIERLLNE